MGINPTYLDEETLLDITDAYESSDPKSITLQQFFEEDTYQLLRKQIVSGDFTIDKKPMHHNFEKKSIPGGIVEMFKSPEFLELLSATIGRKVKLVGEVQRFGWKDYTIIHDDDGSPQFDVIIDFGDEWNSEWGGSIIYVDGTGDYVKMPVLPNQLIIVDRKGLKRFVKYCNHNSDKNKRYLVVGRVE